MFTMENLMTKPESNMTAKLEYVCDHTKHHSLLGVAFELNFGLGKEGIWTSQFLKVQVPDGGGEGKECWSFKLINTLSTVWQLI